MASEQSETPTLSRSWTNTALLVAVAGVAAVVEEPAVALAAMLLAGGLIVLAGVLARLVTGANVDSGGGIPLDELALGAVLVLAYAGLTYIEVKADV